MAYFQVNKKQEIEGYELRTMTGDIVSFTPSYSEPLPEPFSNLHVKCDIVATGGNGTPDNPNPINGYTEANITRCGVNLWDEEWEVGGIDNQTGQNEVSNARIRSKNYIPVLPNTDYYFCGTNAFNYVMFYGSDYSYLSYVFNKANQAVTIPNNAYYMRFVNSTAYGTTYNNDISINYPSSDTTYHAYTGNAYAIALGDTYYGGVLDVTRGKLHVTYGKDSFSDKSFTQYSTGFFAITSYTSAKLNGTGLCEIYTVAVDKSYANAPDNSMQFRGNQILIKDTSCADVTALIARTGSHEFTYELATPFDIDLTPEVISAVVGTNNVFADCGQTEVTCLI